MEMRKYTLFALEVCLSVTMTGLIKITVYPDQLAFSDLLWFQIQRHLKCAQHYKF